MSNAWPLINPLLHVDTVPVSLSLTLLFSGYKFISIVSQNVKNSKRASASSRSVFPKLCEVLSHFLGNIAIHFKYNTLHCKYVGGAEASW